MPICVMIIIEKKIEKVDFYRPSYKNILLWKRSFLNFAHIHSEVENEFVLSGYLINIHEINYYFVDLI